MAQDFGPFYDKKFVVKAQIMKTARSKGFFRENGFNSGIHKADTCEQVRDIAQQMCGNHLINNITPVGGLLCRGVLVTEDLIFTDKYYLNF